MAVDFVIPGPLQELAGGREEVRVACGGRPLGEALPMLWSECPGIRDRVVNELGEVRQHVNIFVDGENIRDAAGLATPLPEGAEVLILPAISGG